MKRYLMAACAMSLLFGAAPAAAQVEGLRFDAARVPVGRVSHYRKSRLDGSHATRISVYLESPERIESLKWDAGETRATLVVAHMDWTRFSVRGFESWSLVHDTAPELRATLTVTGAELRASFMEQPVRLAHWPWHSYDFDFTSFTLTLPHRIDHRRELSFWRTDFVYSDPPVVAELGEITLRYEAPDTRNGIPAWRYTLGGPGLSGKRGEWWVDRRSGLTIEYRLPIGDEPGYDDVWLRLESTAPMTPEEWQSFRRAAVAGS